MEAANEKGGGTSDARRLESFATARITENLRKINTLHRSAWSAESRRLLSEFQRSGNRKHLRAFLTHCAGIGKRIASQCEEVASR